MKKIGLGVAALLMLGSVACKKDYTCACTLTSTQEFGPSWGDSFEDKTTVSSTEYSLTKQKEDDAKSKCTGYEYSDNYELGDVKYSDEYSCELSEM